MKNKMTKTISITQQPIRLGQFLKHANHVQDGIEAKFRIQEGDVTVNGSPETRRGRQLFNDDLVEIDDTFYHVKYESTR